LEAEEIFARFFFIAFLNSPCYETPKNAIKIKKNRTKQPRVKKKKTEEKKAAFFVMSPDGFFRGKVGRIWWPPQEILGEEAQARTSLSRA
jgi:hypothetical protein